MDGILGSRNAAAFPFYPRSVFAVESSPATNRRINNPMPTHAVSELLVGFVTRIRLLFYDTYKSCSRDVVGGGGRGGVERVGTIIYSK